MGLYDLRCMVTGLSLRGIDATLVVLRRSGEAYRPITLGIAGSYDRYGGIDAVIEDVNTDLVLTHFLDRRRNGGFVLDTNHLKIDADSPVTDIEDLLWCFERNCLCLAYDFEDPVATLDGELVTFALIAQPVWNALAAVVAPSQESASAWFEGLFRDSSVAGQIYRERLADVSEHVRELYAVSDFMTMHGLTWAPPGGAVAALSQRLWDAAQCRRHAGVSRGSEAGLQRHVSTRGDRAVRGRGRRHAQGGVRRGRRPKRRR